MLVESPHSEPSPTRGPVLVGLAIAGVLVIAALIAYMTIDRREPAPAEMVRREAPAVAEEPVDEPEPAPEAPAPVAPRTPARRPAPGPAPAETPEEAPTLATLTVESDVPGATVFLDREYIGETPVTVRNLQPGTKRLNVSAEGYDSVSREVSLEAGAQSVAMRFREVRLDERMPVVHRHGMGSCEGQLVATLDGLRYETSNRNDGFSLTYEQVEMFEVNYLEKNLRVKQRGGRTWNFTERNAGNADALFVFHRDVQAAREKLAKGYAPIP